MQKILLVGAFHPDPSVYTYALSFERAMRDIGYEVMAYNYRQKFAYLAQQRMNQKLLQVAESFRPDLIFFLKAETIYAPVLRALKRLGCVLVNFYPDNPFAVAVGNSSERLIATLPLYDRLFIWSRMLMPALYSIGCNDVQYFPFGFDETVFARPVLPRFLPDVPDVCFIGTWEPDRESLLATLRAAMPHLNLAIWGNQWTERLASSSPLRACVRGEAMYGDAMIAAFRESKIVLNLLRRQNYTSHNMRTMEIPASRAFQLAQRSFELAEYLFQEDKNIVCFDTDLELIQKIEWYVSREVERQALTDAGFEHVQRYGLRTILREQLALVLKVVHEANVTRATFRSETFLH